MFPLMAFMSQADRKAIHPHQPFVTFKGDTPEGLRHICEISLLAGNYNGTV